MVMNRQSYSEGYRRAAIHSPHQNVSTPRRAAAAHRFFRADAVIGLLWQREPAEEIGANAFSEPVASEMDGGVYDSCDDIKPRQDLHGDAGEVRDHGLWSVNIQSVTGGREEVF